MDPQELIERPVLYEDRYPKESSPEKQFYSISKNFAMNNIIVFVIRKIDYRFFLFSLIFSFLLLKSEITNSKKMINVYGKYFECKSPKNSFDSSEPLYAIIST